MRCSVLEKGAAVKMRCSVLFWLFWQMALMCGAEESKGHTESYRLFTLRNGKEVEARIAAYKHAEGMIQLERPNHKSGWVKQSAFSEKDQPYLKEWIVADHFFSSQFRIAANKITKQNNSYYELTLSNMTDVSFQDVKVDFRIYIKTYGTGNRPTRIYCYRRDVEIIDVGEMLPRTKTMKIASGSDTSRNSIKKTEYQRSTGSLETTITKTDRREVTGIWLKIYGPPINGIPTVREFCEPESLREKVSWVEIPSLGEVKPMLSLEEIKKRGKADTDTEHYSWAREIKHYCWNTEEVTVLQQASDGLAVFYDVRRDSGATDAIFFATQCKEMSLFGRAVFWNEIVANLPWRKAFRIRIHTANVELTKLYLSIESEEVHDTSKAAASALRALEKDNNSPELLAFLAYAYACDQQFELAVRAQEKAFKRLSSNTKKAAKGEQYSAILDTYRKKTVPPRRNLNSSEWSRIK